MVWMYFLSFHWLSLYSVDFIPLQKIFGLVKSHLSIFAFVDYAFGVILKKIIAQTNVKKIFFLFFSDSFMASGLTLNSLIHFELNFAYGMRQWFNFILVYVEKQFSQHHLLKRLSFPCRMFWHL